MAKSLIYRIQKGYIMKCLNSTIDNDLCVEYAGISKNEMLIIKCRNALYA